MKSICLSLISTVLLASIEGYGAQLPPAIRAAFESTQQVANQSNVRNNYMLRYTYYTKGLCRNQDCSTDKVKTETTSALAKMGDDLEKYSLHLEDYVQALSSLQNALPPGDWTTLASRRSYVQNLKYGIFVTCVDFAKVVMGKALDLGFPNENIRIYVTMISDTYKKMCPATDGTKPAAPRPIVHALVAYKDAGQWYALNVEDPDAVPFSLGVELPKRLGREHQFTFPALIAYQKLLFAGAYTAQDFVNGYPDAWLSSISANGRLEETEPGLLKCE